VAGLEGDCGIEKRVKAKIQTLKFKASEETREKPKKRKR